VLQCVAVCCSMLQCMAVCSRVLVCCHMLQYGAMWCGPAKLLISLIGSTAECVIHLYRMQSGIFLEQMNLFIYLYKYV